MIVHHEGDPPNFCIFQFARAVTLRSKKLRDWPQGIRKWTSDNQVLTKQGIPEIQLISQLVQDTSACSFSELSWPFKVPAPMICKVVKGKPASDLAWMCTERLVLQLFPVSVWGTMGILNTRTYSKVSVSCAICRAALHSMNVNSLSFIK